MSIRSALSLVLAAFWAAASPAMASDDAGTPEAREVPTQRIIIPEEQPRPPMTPLEDDPVDQRFVVPTDELPRLTGPDAKGNDLSADPDSTIETPPPQVQTDLSQLPPAVAQTHANLIEAAKTGDIENLRPFITLGDQGTLLSFGGAVDDPIAYLKGQSGDDQGHEILAILIEILQAGFVHLDPGTDIELYVWPYFFAYPLADLTPPQRVELLQILTAGDLQDSEQFGSYIFYRLGIRPDGTWAYFLAGD